MNWLAVMYYFSNLRCIGCIRHLEFEKNDELWLSPQVILSKSPPKPLKVRASMIVATVPNLPMDIISTRTVSEINIAAKAAPRPNTAVAIAGVPVTPHTEDNHLQKQVFLTEIFGSTKFGASSYCQFFSSSHYITSRFLWSKKSLYQKGSSTF